MEDIIIEAVEDENENLNEIEPRYNLRSQIQDIEVEKMEERTSLDDALDITKGKNRSERIALWPNDIYHEFMELITEGNISNKIGDKIIKFFNKHNNLQESPLPKSTKSGKDYLNQINSPAIDFKEKTIATHFRVDFKLYYRPIFCAIQAFVERLEVSNNFVLRRKPNFSHGNRSERSFGEPYKCNWWLETEKTLPSLNNLLSIILYSDAITLDGLEKSSGHPVFLTLNMLETDEITATFKSANCKMPCHTCMVMQENLNKMDFESAPPRTHKNMQQVIRNE
ncbi:hypothetical protein C1646_772663 [Rhizophagus diaphanus]|nr:hypothetical protein C1646_772663 [Rhizophagus diaphanus] [Rhizophagus sp. MUCL 43196]